MAIQPGGRSGHRERFTGDETVCLNPALQADIGEIGPECVDTRIESGHGPFGINAAAPPPF